MSHMRGLGAGHFPSRYVRMIRPHILASRLELPCTRPSRVPLVPLLERIERHYPWKFGVVTHTHTRTTTKTSQNDSRLLRWLPDAGGARLEPKAAGTPWRSHVGHRKRRTSGFLGPWTSKVTKMTAQRGPYFAIQAIVLGMIQRFSG